jgi:superoxide dismutase, Fe-Mn family
MTVTIAPISRRHLVLGTSAVLALSAAGLARPQIARAQKAPFQLMKLPYADDALAPVISANTISFHYGKHHRAYVETANKMLDGDPLRDRPLLEIMRAAHADPAKASLFNNVAQIWNHDFYWQSLAPKGGGKPGGRIARMIDASFGDYEKFKAALAAQATGQFGSGWAWLCREGDKLTVRGTPNAETPVLVQGVAPLLAIDVWEHAYYLDYQNRRADHVAAVIDKLLNWDFAEKNLG